MFVYGSRYLPVCVEVGGICVCVCVCVCVTNVCLEDPTLTKRHISVLMKLVTAATRGRMTIMT